MDPLLVKLYATLTFGSRPINIQRFSIKNSIDLRGEDMTVFGDGPQTRILCYVDDLIEGIFRLL